MDIFQLLADFLHLIAMIQLLIVILTSRSVSGLSAKTQLMLLTVFIIRYYGFLYYNPFTGMNLYFSIMKVLFLGLTATTWYYIKYKKPYSLSYSK